MANFISGLVNKVLGLAGRFGPLIEILLGSLGPKLSAGDHAKAAEICNQLDDVANRILELTAFVRQAGEDRQYTASEIAQALDRVEAIGAEVDDIARAAKG